MRFHVLSRGRFCLQLTKSACTASHSLIRRPPHRQWTRFHRFLLARSRRHSCATIHESAHVTLNFACSWSQPVFLQNLSLELFQLAIEVSGLIYQPPLE